MCQIRMNIVRNLRLNLRGNASVCLDIPLKIARARLQKSSDVILREQFMPSPDRTEVALVQRRARVCGDECGGRLYRVTLGWPAN